MKDIKKFNQELSKIKYGWYDKAGNLHESLKDGNFVKDYKMQTIEEVIKHQNSICWDLCEVEREFFKKTKYPFITIFAVLKNYRKKPCHTFLVFKNDNKYYWFEASWKNMKGVKEYSCLEDIFNEIKNNFFEFTKSTNYNKDEIEFFAYKKPIFSKTCNLFYCHCMYLGKKIKNKNYKKLFKN